MTPKIIINDADWRIGEHVDGLFVRKDQDITSDFLDANAEDRLWSSNNRSQDFHKFATIPTAVVEKWLKEGFDVYRESAQAIVKRLKAEDLSDFLTSNKKI